MKNYKELAAINRTLNYLNDMKDSYPHGISRLEALALASKHHVSNNRINKAVEAGYFQKVKTIDGVKLNCVVAKFEPRHARF